MVSSRYSSEPQGDVEEEAAARRVRRYVQVVPDRGGAEVGHFGIEPGVLLPSEQVAAREGDSRVIDSGGQSLEPFVGHCHAHAQLAELEETRVLDVRRHDTRV